MQTCWKCRRFCIFGTAFILSGLLTGLFADLMWRTDFSALKGLLVFLFSLLTLNIAIGSVQAVAGFIQLCKPARKANATPAADTVLNGITAINIPVYNEDIGRVLEGLRVVYNDLAKTGQLDKFHFYILSDSTQPDNWIREECTWALLCRQLKAHGRIFYRRRRDNTHQKAGNILNFCESWGQQYTHMIIFDADSVMDGPTLVEMVKRMEADPNLGILQTVPRLVRAESFYGHMQQFANSAFGPIFSSGLAWWMGPDGNYWGHNAIIRVKAFIRHCGLPDLPGRQPWGGKILSHDFVEAALMLKAGYKVELATDLGGSYEEGPQDLLESAKRDRRWCQGNLQHFWLLFADGIRGISKIHFLNGIFSYAGSLLWALFLIFSVAIAFERQKSDLSLIPRSTTIPSSNITILQHGLLIFILVFTLLLLPKFLASVYALINRQYRNQHGGWIRLNLNILTEIVASTIIAPIMLVFHSRFVIATIFGRGIQWTTQSRGAGGLRWYDTFRALWPCMLIGLSTLTLCLTVLPTLTLWLSPLLIGWILCIPFTTLSSRPVFFPTSQTPQILTELEKQLELDRLGNSFFSALTAAPGMVSTIVDPYVNAIHVTLLREMHGGKDDATPPQLPGSAEELFSKSPTSLNNAQQLEILSSSTLIRQLHHKVWRCDINTLHPHWQAAIQRYELKPAFNQNR